MPSGYEARSRFKKEMSSDTARVKHGKVVKYIKAILSTRMLVTKFCFVSEILKKYIYYYIDQVSLIAKLKHY